MDTQNYRMNVGIEFAARSKKEAEDMALAIKEIISRAVGLDTSAYTFEDGEEQFEVPEQYNNGGGFETVSEVSELYDDICMQEIHAVAESELKLIEAEIRAKGYPAKIEMGTGHGWYKCEYHEYYDKHWGIWQYYYEITAKYYSDLARPYGKKDDYVDLEIGSYMTEHNAVGEERHSKGVAA